MTPFFLNGESVTVDDDPSTPLLWVIRDSLGLTGTKFGCGMALCGACTVHLDGHAMRSCVAPLSRVAGKQVTTIEGLSSDLSHPLQRAWIEIDVPQCGYCQSGQIMSAAVLSLWPSECDFCGHGQACTTSPHTRERSGWWKRAENQVTAFTVCAATPATNLPGEHMPPGNTKSSLPSPEHKMVFVGPSPAELCRQLKASKQTGGRSLQPLLEHVSSDDFVGWACDPGVRCRRFHAWTPPCTRRFGSQAARSALNNRRGLRLVSESD